MTRDGGGWTLLVTSVGNGWTKVQVKERNIDTPSVTDNYSMLRWADNIKNTLSNAPIFEYRLEAKEPGHWGGIWTAPRSYSFTHTSNDQTNVTIIKKFGSWDYCSWDYCYNEGGIEQRMPYVVPNPSKAGLTTSSSPTRAWWGTIIEVSRQFKPAPWMHPQTYPDQPGKIWYWMREGKGETLSLLNL